mgnify:CR=1 FL=1
MDDVYDFGARLQELRKAQNLSQRQLAAKSGVNRDTINRYESYVEAPHADILKNLALTLHTTTDYLLGMPDAPAIKYYDMTPEEAQEVGKQLADEWLAICWIACFTLMKM